MSLKKNTAVTGFPFGLVSLSDGSDVTTGTPVGFFTLDGGTQTAIGDVSPVHEGNGEWTFDLTATEMNGDVVGLTFTHVDAITSRFTIITTTRLVSELNDFDSTSDQVTADTVAISGDSAAADNLELMYDGTGYTAETGPASRAQVDNIGAASGGAFAIEATEDNESSPIKGVSSVGTETGTFANTEANDGVYHVITHATNDIDWIYGFDVGGSRTAVSVDFRGFLNSNNDAMFLQAFDFVGTDWETIALLPGQNGSVDIPLIPSLLQKHTGTGSDLGKVYLRFEANGAMSSPVLNVDLLHVLAVNIGQSVGYANGSIWVDTNNGTAGVEPFTNGTGDNPVLTWADALTLSASVGITDFHIVNGSTIQLTANSDNYSLFGDNWTLDLNGQSIAGAHLQGAIVSGTGIGATRPEFTGCEIGTCTLVPFIAMNSGLNGTITFSATGDYEITSCHSSIAGSTTPIIDTGSAVANVNLTMPDYNQGVEIRNLNILGTDLFSISGKGQIIYAASSSGSINQRGDWKVTNTGGVTIVADDNTTNIDTLLDALLMQSTTIATLTSQTSFTLTAGSTDNDAYNGATIVIVDSATGVQKAFGSASDYTGSTKRLILAQDPGVFTMAVGDTVHILTSDTFAIIDRVLAGNTHNVTNSFGKRVRDVIDSVVIFSDTAVSATINTITLSSGASSVDGAYDPADITIVGGKGAGQSRLILQYDGTTKIAVVDRNWKDTPDGTSVFTITTNPGREHVNEGLAQAGASGTITLNTLASAINDAYVGQIVFIRSGTGDDQAKLIIAYNGTTKIATVDSAWGTTPDATSGYVMLPTSPVMLSTLTQAQIDSVETTSDKFAFSVANQVDSNIQSVNDQTVTGDGGVGTEWQGA